MLSSSPYGGGVAPAWPGRVEAEHYDLGGEGVAYHDTTAGNQSGAFRTDDVDVAATTDAGRGYTLGRVTSGEWLKYTVDVVSTGNYELSFRVAAVGAGGTFHLEDESGTNLTGTMQVPNTGGWQSFQTVAKANVPLTAGTHVFKLVMDSQGPGGSVGNFNYLAAFGGAPVALPGVVQAEHYNPGGEGVGYHDTTAGNQSGAYRMGEGVDVAVSTDAGGGYTLGQVAAGEWLKYDVAVPATGIYDVKFRIASASGGGTFHLEDETGANLTGAMTVPNTGGWQSYRDVVKPSVLLSAGTHTMKLVMDGVGSGATAVGNFNYAAFAATPYGPSPVSVPARIEFENYDLGGEGVGFHDTTAANESGQYRTAAGEGVDIGVSEDLGGGFTLGRVSAGEWLRYTVDVPAAGTFDLTFRVASAGTGGTFHLEDRLGNNLTGSLSVPNTGGWQSFRNVAANGVALPAGPNALRLVMDTNGASTGRVGNFNHLTVSAAGTPLPPTRFTAKALSESEVALGWMASAGATGYAVERTLDGETDVVATLPGGSTSFTDDGLPGGSSPSYAVVATNASGSGVAAAAAATTAPAGSNKAYLVTLSSSAGSAGSAGGTNSGALNAPLTAVIASDPEAAVWKAVTGSTHSDVSVVAGPGSVADYAFQTGGAYEVNGLSATSGSGPYGGTIDLEDLTNFSSYNDQDFNDHYWDVTVQEVTVSLTVTDGADATNAITDSGDLYVYKDAQGKAPVTISGTSSPSDDGVQSQARWVVKAAGGAGGADPSDGLLTPAGTNSVFQTDAGNAFPVKAGIDGNLNGELDSDEVMKTVTVHLVEKPTVSVAASVANASEAGPVHGQFTVTRTGDDHRELVIPYTVGGTATGGAAAGGGNDYEELSGTVTILAGQASATVPVTVFQDVLAEMDETVVATLSEPSGGEGGAAPYGLAESVSEREATVTIADDEPKVGVVATDDDATEPVAAGAVGDNGKFTFTRTGDTYEPLDVYFEIDPNRMPKADRFVDYELEDDAPEVVAENVYKLTFAAGESEIDMTLRPLYDGVTEGDEFAKVRIITPSPGLLSSPVGYRIDPYAAEDEVVIHDLPPVDLVAHRTGGKLGETVSEAIEDEGDPRKYLILTNNDFEQELSNGRRDYDDDIAIIPPDASGDEPDDDLAQITLKQISPYASGYVRLELSNYENARLFTSEGEELTDLTLDLASPEGQLAGLLSGDVDVWLEGLEKDADLKFSYLNTSSLGGSASDVISRDDVHLTVAEWAFRDGYGDDVIYLSPLATEMLGYLADNVDALSGETLSAPGQLINLQVDGLAGFPDGDIGIVSDAVPASTAQDVLEISDDVGTSERKIGLYASESDNTRLLTSTQAEVLRARYDTNAVHNPKAMVTLAVLEDEQKRKIERSPSISWEIDRQVVKLGQTVTATVSVVNPNPNLKYEIRQYRSNEVLNGPTAAMVLQPQVEGLSGAYADVRITDAAGDVVGRSADHLGRLIYAVPADTTAATLQWTEQAVAALKENDPSVPAYYLPIYARQGEFALASLDLKAAYDLNNRISRAYARMYNEDADAYSWCGLAAHVSSLGGQGIVATTGATQALALLGKNPARAVGMFQAFTQLNIAIYFDMYRQFAAFDSGGIDAIQAMRTEGVIEPGQLAAWQAVEAGRVARTGGNAALASQKFWEGNFGLADVEQNVVAQRVYDNHKPLFAFLTSDPYFKTQLRSPVPGDNGRFGDVVPTGVNGGEANVAEKDDRWKWVTAPNVGLWDKFKAWQPGHQNINLDDVTNAGLSLEIPDAGALNRLGA